jgi:hypothetical protein
MVQVLAADALCTALYRSQYCWQCVAFTRWKQHKFSEAMNGFIQVRVRTCCLHHTGARMTIFLIARAACITQALA